MNKPIYIHIYMNDSFTCTKQIDTRILLSEFRSILSIRESMYFLYQLLPIEPFSENELKICDILHSNHLYMKDYEYEETASVSTEESKHEEIIPSKTILLRKKKGRNFKNRKNKKYYSGNESFFEHNKHEILTSDLISEWYKNTNLRIRQVNYENDRKRFTSLIPNKERKLIKISLNISDLLNKINLEVFVLNCLEEIEKYFSFTSEKSKTFYMIKNKDYYKIEDKLNC